MFTMLILCACSPPHMGRRPDAGALRTLRAAADGSRRGVQRRFGRLRAVAL